MESRSSPPPETRKWIAFFQEELKPRGLTLCRETIYNKTKGLGGKNKSKCFSKPPTPIGLYISRLLGILSYFREI